jgi:UDP-N-acetyl-D-mannosaminuronic acid transferase (WecB/TagA/CpsF family)
LKLPYASIDELKKKSIKLKKDELAFITLPTPKQEQLSYHLSKKNKYFKIICIGGSIAIASGEEKQVPKFLKNYEYIWRLKNDFKRRIVRIIGSLVYYLKGKYLNNIYNQTIFRLIEK